MIKITMNFILLVKQHQFIFVYCTLILYALNMLVFLVLREWLHAWYWMAAFNITLCVLFMQKGGYL